MVAEDLGMVPDFVRPSLTAIGVPGYRVLRWEKDEARANQPGLPRPGEWPAVSVATSGTHDIETLADWYDGAARGERKALAAIPGLDRRGRTPALRRRRFATRSCACSTPRRPSCGGLRSRTRSARASASTCPAPSPRRNWTYRMAMTVDALAADRETSERLLRMARALSELR